MTTTLDALAIRRRLGRTMWAPPVEFGPDGWMFEAYEPGTRIVGPVAWLRILVSLGPVPGADGEPDPDEGDWVHASIFRRDEVPTYQDLVLLHAAVWPDGHAAQLFVPPSEHINIHDRVLHLWGRPDGRRLLPNFGALGHI
jgi:hypothetical protein